MHNYGYQKVSKYIRTNLKSDSLPVNHGKKKEMDFCLYLAHAW